MSHPPTLLGPVSIQVNGQHVRASEVPLLRDARAFGQRTGSINEEALCLELMDALMHGGEDITFEGELPEGKTSLWVRFQFRHHPASMKLFPR